MTMYQKKLAADIRCPLEYGLSVFGGKWKSRIICVLAQNNKLRYSELRKELANITDAVLAAALKELIADDMVARARLIMKSRRMWSMSLRKRENRLYLYYKAFAAGRAFFARNLTK